ncbi:MULTISPECIES: lysozyme inhibitor LprI family protein [unclassified Cedecea]|uniref:lysozyme inhibitor LprI family protein n=1 Tax=unclassified Cedecea TaxID=2649846 RepID=UPI00301628F8
MKEKIFSLIVVMMFSLPSYAALSTGNERDACFKEHKEIADAYNCLYQKRVESDNQLDVLISEISKKIISNYDYPTEKSDSSDETVGSVYNKYFLDSQKAWMTYKKNLCLGVASSIGEAARDYQSYKDQCEINLNKRHIEELHIMDLPPAR